MFKLFAIVFAAILALASAAPKPGVVAAYSAPIVAPAAYSAYGPVAYSAPVVASPLAYSGQISPLGYTAYYG